MYLEKLDGKNFSCPEEYQQTLNTTNLLVRKTEMVLSSHMAYRWLKLKYIICCVMCDVVQSSNFSICPPPPLTQVPPS